MSVRRARDPARLLPDLVSIDGPIAPGSHEFAALKEILDAGEPLARIRRLRRHAELIERADRLEARLRELSGSMDDRLDANLARAENRATYLDAAPRLTRHANIGNPGQPRVKRTEERDDTIDKDLARYKKSTNDERWVRMSDWVRKMGRSGFDKAMTKRKKKSEVKL